MAKIPFIPHELPIRSLDWQRLLPILGKASVEIGRYDGTLKRLQNPRILLSPLTSNEAVLSSRIEGTQATLGEVLQRDAGIDYDQNKTQEIIEILNYRTALAIAERELEDRNISLELLKSLHVVLLNSARGKDKSPGLFRKDQNWIGPYGCPIELAKFVPPNPFILQEHLEKLQEYISMKDEDPLIQVAVAHAQFEIIHPFKDGNGRIGRMLIPLLLYQRRTLSGPMFYLSEYLEANRQEYEDRLLAISEENDWHGWIEFFLNAICVQAQKNCNKAEQILSLYEQMNKSFLEITRSKFALVALNIFFRLPVVSSSRFKKEIGLKHSRTADIILNQLHEAKCITVIREKKGRKPGVYAIPELINIAEGKTVFNLSGNNPA